MSQEQKNPFEEVAEVETPVINHRKKVADPEKYKGTKRRHNVTISHDLFLHLQQNAIPFEDSVENTIRRLLKMEPRPDLRTKRFEE